jgi:coenzyme F420-0:L-glutamate ligase/coenzyme F420-1:gamma-L-glutamate ligase
MPASEPHDTRRSTELFDVIIGRRSVRRFRADPIPRELVEQVLEAGRWAPSPHGSQPWRFVVLTHNNVKRALAGAMGSAWQHNLAMDGQDPDVIANRVAGSRRRLIEAPVLIIICLYLENLDRYPDPERQAAEMTMAVQSLGGAAQNMLLMAYGLGLDAGWMCAPLFCPDVVRETLQLDDRLIPHALLPLGYAAADPKRRERRALEDLIVKYE